MSAIPEPDAIPQADNVDAETFHAEIRKAARPAVFRGVVRAWPAVAAALTGDAEYIAYLKDCSAAKPVQFLEGRPEEQGRFFYNSRMTGFNFETKRGSFPAFLNLLADQADEPAPSAMAVQSETIAELLPQFAKQNRLDWLPGVEPRIWIGNRIRVAAHYDLKENVAACVSGRRRFTLFPPEAVADLYPGPFELTPAGTPISMVDFANPDLAWYPRFPQAMEQAQQAELSPGDAVYIPYGWWHAVESLEPVSTLVNYWWTDADAALARPYDALLHAVAAFRHLPPEQRDIWKTLVDHYVFEADGPPAAHLPPHARGLLGDASPALFARFGQMLRQIMR